MWFVLGVVLLCFVGLFCCFAFSICYLYVCLLCLCGHGLLVVCIVNSVGHGVVTVV